MTNTIFNPRKHDVCTFKCAFVVFSQGALCPKRGYLHLFGAKSYLVFPAVFDEKPRIFLFSLRPHLIIAKHFIISELVFSRPHVTPHLTPHVRPHVRPHTLSNV